MGHPEGNINNESLTVGKSALVLKKRTQILCNRFDSSKDPSQLLYYCINIFGIKQTRDAGRREVICGGRIASKTRLGASERKLGLSILVKRVNVCVVQVGCQLCVCNFLYISVILFDLCVPTWQMCPLKSTQFWPIDHVQVCVYMFLIT